MPRPMSLLPVLMASAIACTEYNLGAEDDINGNDDLKSDTGVECPPQIPDCNDPDDTQETGGETGFEPADCEVYVPPQREILVNEECIGEGETDPIPNAYDLVIEYQYTSSGSGVIVMPAIGNLDDDNGDGRVDENDIPDIAFTVWVANELVALSGDGSGELFRVTGFDGQGGVTIADVDADGDPEVIAIQTGSRITAVDGTGRIEWTAASFPMQSYPQPTVADLDADGKPEVIGDVGVVNGEDGSTVATLAGIRNSWRTPVAADIDRDGHQEIILGNMVYDDNGNVLWSNGGSGAGNFSAVADVDGDAGGEVFFVSGSTLYLHDDDGTLLRSTTIPGSNPGPPAVADFDGDGQIEIAIPANSQISVFEIDGSERWRSPIQDNSGLAGCSGYDMDGDGAYEVLYADEDALRMYDGATGAVLYEDFTHNSGTVWEYPVIADIDKDDSAEICIASNGATWKGITCFGHNGDGWPKSGPTWGTHDFAVTNLEPDGSVPRVPEASWEKYNVFRARPSVDEPPTADLIIDLADICVASCDTGPVKLVFQPGNQGGEDVEAGVSWALYKVHDDVRSLVTTGILDALPSGIELEGIEVHVMPDDIGNDGFVVVIDDDGAGWDSVSECDETNNEYVWAAPICN